jgi:spore coat protein U-like protein
MKSNKFKLAAATALAFVATAASAGTDNSQSIAVSTTVANKCIVAAGATLGFAAYDPVVTNAATPAGDLTGTGTFQVRCTKGSTGVNVGMGLGAHASAGPALPRNMSAGGADALTYHLYQPTGAALDTCGGSTVWDDNTGKLAVGSAFWSNSANKTVSVCGKIPGAQDVAAGSYTDTVVIDVTF